jgi:hypothetical protein
MPKTPCCKTRPKLVPTVTCNYCYNIEQEFRIQKVDFTLAKFVTRRHYFVADADWGFAFWHRGRYSLSVFALALTHTTIEIARREGREEIMTSSPGGVVIFYLSLQKNSRSVTAKIEYCIKSILRTCLYIKSILHEIVTM